MNGGEDERRAVTGRVRGTWPSLKATQGPGDRCGRSAARGAFHESGVTGGAGRVRGPGARSGSAGRQITRSGSNTGGHAGDAGAESVERYGAARHPRPGPGSEEGLANTARRSQGQLSSRGV